MIQNIPMSGDFFYSGKHLLDFAWDVVARLLTDLDEAEYFEIDVSEIEADYWAAAKRYLTTALSITQQGVELLLKGRIAEVSPYLLLADPPAKWPASGPDGGPDFAAFRTLDAQDLIRVHDIVTTSPLPPVFAAKFNELRLKRNRILHSIDKTIGATARDVVESLLFMHRALFPTENWPSVRLAFLTAAPSALLGGNDYTRNTVCREVAVAMDLLPPAMVEDFFRVSKRQRLYICPTCYDDAETDMGFEYRLANLSPKGPKSTALYCPVCNDCCRVVRGPYDSPACKGNVISEDCMCLTCGSYLSDAARDSLGI